MMDLNRLVQAYHKDLQRPKYNDGFEVLNGLAICPNGFAQAKIP